MARSGFNLDFSESFPHLDRAPAVEAVIHWRARIGHAWEGPEIQSLLSKELKDYPQSAPQRILEFQAMVAPDLPPLPSQRNHWQGLRFTSADGLHIAQFLRDGLIYSRLKPYTDWVTFSTEALRLWRIFVQLGAPAEIERLGVRYINRVELEKPEDFRDLLKRPPDCLEPLGFPLTEFLYQSTHDVPNLPFKINVVRAMQPSNAVDGFQHSLIVDIDVVTTRALECRDEVVRDHLTKMRWLKNKAFFDLFSKRARELFGETHDGPPG
jgi:uncharacterized protein (TIGR04255 family)